MQNLQNHTLVANDQKIYAYNEDSWLDWMDVFNIYAQYWVTFWTFWCL